MCFRSLTALLVCSCVAGSTSLLVGCRMAGVEFFPQSSGAENEIAYDSGLAAQEAINAVNPHAMQPLVAPPPKTEERTPLLQQNLDDLLSDGMSAIRDAEQNEDARVHLSHAKRAFQAALDADPNSAVALQGMGIVADLSQDWPAAERYYSRALSLKPNDADVINNLGYSYLLQNRLADATQTLSRALQSDPEHASANANLAIVHVRQGNIDEALRRLTSIYDYEQAQTLLALLINEQRSMNPVEPTDSSTTLSQIVAARPAGSAEPWLPPPTGYQSPPAGGAVMAAPPVTAALPAPGPYSAPGHYAAPGQSATPQQYSTRPVTSAPVTDPSAPSTASPLAAARPVGSTFAIPTGNSNSDAAPQQAAPPPTSTAAPPPFHPTSSTTDSAPNAQTSSRPDIRFPAWPAQQPAAPETPPAPPAPQPPATPVLVPGFSTPNPRTASPGMMIQPSATTSGEAWPVTSGPNSHDGTRTGQWSNPATVARSTDPHYSAPPTLPTYPTQPAPAYSQFPGSSANETPAVSPAHMPPVSPMPQQMATQPVMSTTAPWSGPLSQPSEQYPSARSTTAAVPNALSRYQAAQQQQQGAYNRALEQMRLPLGSSSVEAAVPSTNHGGRYSADGRPVHVYPSGM